MIRLNAILLAVFISFTCYAQVDSTSTIVDTKQIGGERVDINDSATIHSPRKAAILSAVCPGAGQIYNKKYWKLPLVYGGIGVSLGLGIHYRKQFIEYRDAYRLKVDDDPTTGTEFDSYTEPQLADIRDTYRRWMELSYITAGLFYVLQIVDANVDAHLMEFDVSDDLSLNWHPHSELALTNGQPTIGLKLALNLKYK